jgi:hypothetical protein
VGDIFGEPMVARLILRTFAGGESRLTWQSLPAPRKEKEVSLDESTTMVVRKGGPDQENKDSSSLVNSSDSEDTHPVGVSGFGLLPRPTTFGLNARRQVKRLAAVIDGLAAGPQEVIFFTGTLPGSTPKAMLALSQWSGFMAHRLKAWMHDIDSEYKCLFVWEWQKRGALHMHAAVYVKNIANRNRIYNEFKMQWVRLLESVCERSGVDVFARGHSKGTWRGHYSKIRAEAEWVKKSVASYLGKYMSKAVGPGSDKAKFFYPSRWWGSTQNLKELEKAARTEDEYLCPSTGQAESAYNSMEGLMELCSSWSTSYPHKVMPGRTFVGCNTSVPLVRKLFKRGLGMRSLSENKSLRECLDEMAALTLILHNEDSEWFAGVQADYSVIGTYLRHVAGQDFADNGAPDRGVLLAASAIHMLHHAAISGCRYRQKALHPREVLSIRMTYRRVMNAVEEYLSSRYIHSLEEISYIGRPVG